jgi:hypothetical protein
MPYVLLIHATGQQLALPLVSASCLCQLYRPIVYMLLVSASCLCHLHRPLVYMPLVSTSCLCHLYRPLVYMPLVFLPLASASCICQLPIATCNCYLLLHLQWHLPPASQPYQYRIPILILTTVSMVLTLDSNVWIVYFHQCWKQVHMDSDVLPFNSNYIDEQWLLIYISVLVHLWGQLWRIYIQ